MAEVDAHGQVMYQLPNYDVPWGFFTLQDAIDFAIFAVKSTIDAIRFQLRAKTVGDPIDVLVVKPDDSHWVQKNSFVLVCNNEGYVL